MNIDDLRHLKIKDIDKRKALKISENINIKLNEGKISNISFCGKDIKKINLYNAHNIIIYCLMYDYVDLLSIMFENLSLIKNMSKNTNKVIERVNNKQKD